MNLPHDEISELIQSAEAGTLNPTHQTLCFKLARSHDVNGKGGYTMQQYPFEMNPEKVDLRKTMKQNGRDPRAVEPFATYESAFKETAEIRDQMLTVIEKKIASVDDHCCEVLEEKNEQFYGLIQLRVTDQQKKALLDRIYIVK